MSNDAPAWWPDPCHERGDTWRGVHLLAAIGLLLRLATAWFSKSIFQADEVFQYLEQGHRLVYGYGYLPWEYRFGARTFVIPKLVAAVLQACRFLHIDSPSSYLLVVKAVCCLLSVSLIYASYHIARNLASETAGRVAALLACAWYELVYFAHKPTPEILAAYCLLAALGLVLSRRHASRPFFAGGLSALAAVMRPQYAPILLVLGLAARRTWTRSDFARAGLAFLVVIAWTGYLDSTAYGSWFASYRQIYLYNCVHHVSSLFGTRPAVYFAIQLLLASMGTCCLAYLLGFRLLPKTWIPMACVAANLIPHALIAHKEYRFLLVSIPCLLIILAIVLAEQAGKARDPARRARCLRVSLGVMLALSGAGFFHGLPGERKVYASPMFRRKDLLEAYLQLHDEPDLSGLLVLQQRWWKTGGYAYLHRNVPIYFAADLASRQVGPDGYRQYASHVLCPATLAPLPGFEVAARIGALEIRKQTAPPRNYKIIGGLDVVRMPGIDDRYVPAVQLRY